MRYLFTLFVALGLVALAPACKVTDKAIETAQVSAAGNDRYTELAQQCLDGTVDPDMGLEPITPEILEATPPEARLLISRLLQALHANRFAAYSILFQLDEGPDPDTLDLEPLALPETPDEPDENDDLLEETD